MLVFDEQGLPLDAHFSVEDRAGQTVIVFESRGGGRDTAISRNQDYNPGLELLLARLGRAGATLLDAYVDSARVQSLPLDARRLLTGDLPLDLANAEANELRLKLTRDQRPIGRVPGAQGAGNRTRRVALVVAPGQTTDLEAYLAGVAGSDVAEAEQAMLALTRGRAQGFSSDPAARRAVERHAVAKAQAFFRKNGWEADDVGSHESYDLLCTGPDGELHVEVKGTTSTGETVLLTRNEVEHARIFPRVALFVLSSIVLSRDPGGKPHASGGSRHVIDPWLPSPENLRPLAFRYSVE